MTIRQLTHLSAYVAIIFILSFVPYTGYITVGTISITTIPFIIAMATYHLGFRGAITTAFTFGITSYLVALQIGSVIFVDPVVSIVPRFLLGFVIYGIYKLLGKFKTWKYVLLVSSTVIMNTVLVTTFIFISSTYYNDSFKGSFYFWLTLIYINFIVEISVAIFISIVTSHFVKRII